MKSTTLLFFNWCLLIRGVWYRWRYFILGFGRGCTFGPFVWGNLWFRSRCILAFFKGTLAKISSCSTSTYQILNLKFRSENSWFLSSTHQYPAWISYIFFFSPGFAHQLYCSWRSLNLAQGDWMFLRNLVNGLKYQFQVVESLGFWYLSYTFVLAWLSWGWKLEIVLLLLMLLR